MVMKSTDGPFWRVNRMAFYGIRGHRLGQSIRGRPAAPPTLASLVGWKLASQARNGEFVRFDFFAVKCRFVGVEFN